MPSEGKDVPLSTAVGNLIRAFEDQKKMTLSFILYKESGTETVKILARKDSLKEIEFEHNGYVTFNRDMTTNGISNGELKIFCSRFRSFVLIFFNLNYV